jgi:hypothetical protein
MTGSGPWGGAVPVPGSCGRECVFAWVKIMPIGFVGHDARAFNYSQYLVG